MLSAAAGQEGEEVGVRGEGVGELRRMPALDPSSSFSSGTLPGRTGEEEAGETMGWAAGVELMG